MGSSSSKPVRSAANTVSRRQYPKQPTSPPTASPSATVQAQQSRAQPPPRPSREPQTSPQDQTIQSNEQASQVKSSGRFYSTWCCGARAQEKASKAKQQDDRQNVTNQNQKQQPSTWTAAIPNSLPPSDPSAPSLPPRHTPTRAPSTLPQQQPPSRTHPRPSSPMHPSIHRSWW